ncbi:NAD(P)/FAD-dependent oxidoreductase [Amycolatopsis dendrobii]|uniref:FAD-dependent oxidoreductase n=1 Tax=Amycolatopsis dendrobii TaxID=2760662 RepID=A0A7W3VTS4_9PSEU|nr:FAD-dependent oxidoreductase [Amycolatopsis dendrobii]MBB1153038.1 FAD-dependent oxidoreductase [Amycolatopsis dendrobii]
MTTTVLGAGYAGVMAANRLAGRGEEVVLVTPNAWFVERIRLHRVATGLRENARLDLETVLNPAVEVVQDTATKVGEDKIQLASGESLPYDTLVYAVGSGASDQNGTYRIVSEQETERFRAALAEEPDAPVTVVGAGLTGVELAGALREAGRVVKLVSTTPERRAIQAHLRFLAKQGVEIELGRRVDPAGLDGLVVDTTGFAVPSLAADSGLPVDDLGRLLVDEQLTVPGHPDILGAGDAVHIETPSCLRAACATALPMGAHAADVIAARREGGAGQPFRMGYVLQCTDLGGGRGRVQFLHPDDTERAIAIDGRAGGLVKETICRMTVRWLAQERDRAGRYSWPAGA